MQLDSQSRKGLTETRTWPMYVCDSNQQCCFPSISSCVPVRPTYISAFSKRFFRLSFIASFDILLMSVRSETPTSFFLVLSKAAFRTWGFPPPLLAACALLVSFLRPARFVTAYKSSSLISMLHLGKAEKSSAHTMVIFFRIHGSIEAAPTTENGDFRLEKVGSEHRH